VSGIGKSIWGRASGPLRFAALCDFRPGFGWFFGMLLRWNVVAQPPCRPTLEDRDACRELWNGQR
jgi:hypothetical protein